MFIKILYKTEYFGRILYALNINGKFTLVYKSSGLSGTSPSGRILPFMFLNTENRFSGPMLGYIFKEMKYDNMYITHRKRMEDFMGLEDKMDTIKQFLIDNNEYEAPDVSPDMEDFEEYKTFVTEINVNLYKAIENYKEFDFLSDKIN